MICHTKTIVFIHIPKCAGSSINNALNLKVHAGTGHAGYFAHKEFIDKGYFCFSFIRNPWDRVVSLYHYFLNMNPGHQWYGQNKQIADEINNVDFETFCEKLDFFQKSPASGIHFIPMHQFIRLEHNKNIVIGRFEHIQKDFENICNRVNIEVSKLPTLNISNHNPYKEYYNNKTIDAVYKKYKQDIDMFDYQF
jgi:hypothetical protein